MTQAFSAQLRSATWRDHQSAAGDSYLHRLVKGAFSRASYRLLVVQLREVYRALEATAQHHGDTIAAPFHERVLDRSARLDADLDALGGAGDLPVLPETRAYVAAITATASDPAAYVAHHYTRYLGDLSGGVFIGRALEKHFGTDVTTFYRFDIADLDAYKDGYRSKLDALPLDDDGKAHLIDVALAAYEHNSSLLQAIGRASEADTVVV